MKKIYEILKKIYNYENEYISKILDISMAVLVTLVSSILTFFADNLDPINVILIVIPILLAEAWYFITTIAVRNKTKIKNIKNIMIQNNEDKTEALINSNKLPVIISSISSTEHNGNIENNKPSLSYQLDNQGTNNQNAEISNPKINEAIIKQKGQNNILELMMENMGEIRDYFSISKNHAKLSFGLAIFNCIIGIALLGAAVYFALVNKNIEPAIIAVITGAISELFAATSLIVHKKAITQLNHYYNALHNNEMFLSTVNLVGNISIDKQDEMYIKIIENEMEIRKILGATQATLNANKTDED